MSSEYLTAGELRAALTDLRDDAAVILVLSDTSAAWLRRVRYSGGFVDLLGGPTAHERDGERPHDRTVAEIGQ